MFADIETFNFFVAGNTQADGGLDDFEDDGHGYCHPYDDAANAEELYEEQMNAAAVEEAVGVVEETNEDGADSTAAAVNSDGADRIVDFEFLINEFDNDNNENTGNNTDDGGAECVHIGAASAPLRVMETSGAPFFAQVKIMVAVLASAAEMVVVTRICAA